MTRKLILLTAIITMLSFSAVSFAAEDAITTSATKKVAKKHFKRHAKRIVARKTTTKDAINK